LENVVIFHGHLVYFTDIWDILWPFGTFWVHLVHFSGFGIKKNLATHKCTCNKNYGQVRLRYKNWSGSNATIASYSSSDVKIYKTMSSLVRFENKYFLLHTLKKRSSLGTSTLTLLL
jgi:hypothetical protein